MGDQHNFAVLDWLVGEIEETLDEARQALEAYVEDPKDSTRIRFCLTHIHQVHGSLHMVEFHGPSLLAEEMEFLAQAIMNNAVSSMSDALEVLMRSLLQLPIYLDHVKVYRDDSATYILPLLNDLRAVRKESYLSETNLFTPDLSSLANISGKRHAVLGDEVKLGQLLKKLREMYQFAAASVLRNIKVDENLIYLEKVFGRLELVSAGTASQPQWQVASALVDGLKRDDIELSVAVRGLLRYIARELRILAEQAPGSFDAPPNSSLFKNMLFYVAGADDGSDKIAAVKSRFALDKASFGQKSDSPNRGNSSASSLDPETVKSVVTALGEELNSIKTNLDGALNGHVACEDLSEVIPVVKRVADTLAVLGISDLRKQMLAQVEGIEKLSKANELDEEQLTEVATKIIEVEQRLEAIGKGVETNRDIDNIDERTIEIDEAKMVVVRECQLGLEKAKDAIVEYISSQWMTEHLDKVDVLLADIRGGLDIIPLPRPAAIVRSCRDFIREQLIEGAVEPDWKTLELLADCIASVDYYLERLTGDMTEDANSLLDIAEESLQQLGYTITWVDSSESQAEEDKPAGESSRADLDVHGDADDASSDSITAEQGEHGGDQLNNDQAFLSSVSPDIDLPEQHFEADQIEPSADSVVATSEEPTAEINEVVASPEQEPDDEEDDIDDEIVEIFIEEAREVVETLEEFVPLWLENVIEDENRSTVRRAFHTLKGSGRMVSASDISELAWEVENMLNRVMDNSVEYLPEHGQLVKDMLGIVPPMIDAFEAKKGDPAPETTAKYSHWAKSLSEGNVPDDIFNLDVSAEGSVEHADNLVDGEGADNVVGDQNIDTVAAEVDAVTSGDLASEAQAAVNSEEEQHQEDLVLREIFSSEAKTHLATIEEFVREMEEDAPIFSPPSNDLQRALHTLKGSAKMAQVTDIASMAEPLESLAKELVTYQVSVTEDILQLIRDAVEYTKQGLDSIEAGEKVSIQKLDQFLARTAELREISVGHLVRLKELEEDSQHPVDPRLLSIFMAEEMMLLLDADVILKQWLASPEESNSIPALMAELSKLSVGAEQANHPDMSLLSRQLLGVHERLLANELPLSSSVVDTLCDGHSVLLDMVDAIAAGQHLRETPPETLAKIDELLEREKLSENADEYVVDEFAVDENGAEVEEITLEESIDDENAASEELVEDIVSAELEEQSNEESDLDFAMDSDDLTIDYQLPESGASEINFLETEAGHEKGSSDEGSSEEPSAEIGLVVDANTKDSDVDVDVDIDDVTFEDDDAIEISAEGFTAEGFVSDSLDGDDEIEMSIIEEPVVDEPVVEEDAPAMTAVKSKAQSPSGESAPTANESGTVSGLLDEIDRSSEEFDEEIIEVFLEEADEIIEDLDGAIHEWEDDWTNPQPTEEIQRALHTLKGGARLSGMTNLGELTHNYESFLINVKQDDIDDQFFSTIHDYQDQVLSGIRAVKEFMSGDAVVAHADDSANKDLPVEFDVEAESTEGSFEDIQDSLTDSVEVSAGNEDSSVSTNVVQFTAKQRTGDSDGGFAMPNAGGNPGAVSPMAKKSGPQELVKVPSELLEELVNLAGETSISRARLEEQVSEFSYSLDEIDSTLQRLQEQLRRLDKETEAQVLFRREQMAEDEEFDPLEMDRYSNLQQLSRSLTESASDLEDLKTDLGEKLRDTETLLLQQSRINTTLQEGLMRSRMVPFSRLVPRLRRIVRQVAGELGKNVSFELDNIEGELDRTVLERMVPPFEHMLRNAVDHGLESPEERISAGKSESGRIVLTLGREAGDVIIRLADDGRGVNLKRVREKAIERELMTENAELTDHDIMQFILHAGFSTAENVTQISGRGVGMDVVHSEIKQLGGSVVINSEWGKGTEFVIRLPFTLSVNRALMVEVGNDHYAIPLSSIEGIVRVSPFELEHYYSNPDARFEYANENYHVRYLGSMLNPDARPNLEGHVLPLPVLLVRSAEHTMALQVDGLMGSREVVVKSLGQQFSAVLGLSGATVMGDGSVVVILDPNALVRQEIAIADKLIASQQSGQIANVVGGPAVSVTKPVQTAKTIMVVDDSVTVRKVTTRFLEREGFDVITAKDGVDALRILQDQIPDLMLLDIEMPRMDGFEVARNVRSTSRWSHLPIIMITSRTGEKHRDHAYSLGVDNYLGKPYQEDILLDAIGQLIDATQNQKH